MNLKTARKSEDVEQIMVVSWARWNEQRYPELKLLYHCPNGGSRNKAEAVKLKQMGTRAGIPDLCFPVPKGKYAGLYIEMKSENGRLQENQKETLRLLARYGNYCAICHEANEAIRVLEEYLELKETAEEKQNEMKAPNLTIYKKGKKRSVQ